MTDAKARFTELVRERAYKEGTFTLTSGKTSNFYVNGKMVALHPEGLALASGLILDILDPDVEAVGGLTMGADPIVGGVVAMSWARARPVSGFLIRKEAKEHGTQALIEGPLETGQVVCIMEDTTTTGGSLKKAIAAAEQAGCRVAQIITLIDREEGGGEMLRAEGYRFDALITLNDIRSLQETGRNT